VFAKTSRKKETFMSTSLLYHAFGLRGYRYRRTQYNDGHVFFTVEMKPDLICCPSCNCRQVVRRGKIERRFRSLPIGRKTVWIVLAIQRVWCSACHRVRQVRVNFTDPRYSYTRAFERYALELCRHMTIKDVAGHLKVSWDMIKDIQKRYLQKRFSRPKLNHLKKLAIDEISIGAGHRYLTIVLDLESGAVVFVGDGKGADALMPFWRRLRRSGAAIEAVAIDMSPAYILAVRENLPGALVVFDHFHVIKLYNDKLSDLRRQLFNQIEEPQKKQVIKGTRWLLLKNPENLDLDRSEPDRLKAALELNRPLATAYYMKEDLRQIWEQPDKKTAKTFLADWVYRAGSSMIPMLKKMARTIAVHHQGILAYYDHPISTGPLEGTNNKIKTMKRQAYGFRDDQFSLLSKIIRNSESLFDNSIV
jgi:transposase